MRSRSPPKRISVAAKVPAASKRHVFTAVAEGTPRAGMRSDAMQCQDCGTTWYSRVAEIIVKEPQLGRCARCGGRLALAEPADVAPERTDFATA